MNKLHLTKHKFTLRFTMPAHLPPFIGNTLRGAFGQALCDNFCEVYDVIFKQEHGSGLSIPNPFVISTPYPSKGDYQAGDELKFYLTLFGKACRYEEDVKAAVPLMCNGKLEGAEMIGAEQIYSRVWSDEGAESIPYCDVLEINFLTPTEILHSKRPVFEPDIHTLISSLFGRISGIIDNYTDSLFVLPYSLAIAKPVIRAEYDTAPIAFQTSGQPINGFTGKVRYFGDVTRYLPYIDLGSQIHIGKKTTRTCGEYTFF